MKRELYNQFMVRPSGRKVNLGRISTDEREHGWHGHEHLDELLLQNSRKLFDLQFRLYAENRQSLLIVLQALDTGGKDGAINHVMSVMNPQGCRIQSFKTPTLDEASHDFLWREHCVAPRRGEVVIFNRSHYEDVLAGRVHGQVKGKVLKQHFAAINDFEKLLADNGAAIVKFFFHISKDEQLRRFGERLDDPDKQWKISENDYREREFWDDYMEAFNDVFNCCSAADAPWFIIPADNKKFRNLAVSEILVHTLEQMDPQIPPPAVDIERIRLLYHCDQTVPAATACAALPDPVPAECRPEDSKKKKKRKHGKKGER